MFLILVVLDQDLWQCVLNIDYVSNSPRLGFMAMRFEFGQCHVTCFCNMKTVSFLFEPF